MRSTPILIGAAALTLLAGCGGSSKSSTSSTPNQQSSSSNSSSISSPMASAKLSKADYLTQTNKICLTENGKLNAIPTPSGLTDYPTIVTNLNGTLAEFKSYLQQVEALVPQSPDAAELQAKWIEPEKAELTKVEGVITRMVADAQAKNSTKIQTDAADLDAASAASTAIAKYLTSYGLTDCASLESS